MEIYIKIPEHCPFCGSNTRIKESISGIKTLWCSNEFCTSKLINRLDHFCGKKGLDIKGLSKMTLEKLINWGWVSNIEDVFKLFEHKDEWIKKSGFGDKSVKNILTAINESRNCSLNKFIAALGIPLIGNVAAKQLAEKFLTWENFIEAVHDKYDFYLLPNMGVEMDSAIIHFDYSEALRLTNYLVIQNYKAEQNVVSTLKDKTFVITGKLKQFKNRAELKTYIETCGGRVTDSVTSKTDYLVNNDITSTSSKNKKAQDLGIPIITEETLIILAKGEQE